MNAAALLATLLLVVTATGMTVASPASPPSPPRFETRVEAVSVDVSVHDRGRYLAGLTAEDFELFDDGVRQRIEVASGADIPLHATLVLDTSGSVAGEKLERLKAGLRTFVDRLSPADHVSLLTFAYDVRRETSQPERAAVLAALERMTASGTTALYDAFFAALLQADPRHGRPVIVAFTDGEDRVSLLSPDRVLAAARSSEAAVYAVGISFGTYRKPVLRAGSSQGEVHRSVQFVQDLADGTGGRTWPADVDRLEQTFVAVVAELRSRYVLRYEPQGVAAGGWHQLKVRLKRGSGEVRARRGYLRSPGN